MAANNSNEATWADQWDYSNPHPITVERKNNSNGNTAAKYKQKVGEGLGKTKAVASSGVRKVKVGTAVGIRWIKEKYHQKTQKN